MWCQVCCEVAVSLNVTFCSIRMAFLFARRPRSPPELVASAKAALGVLAGAQPPKKAKNKAEEDIVRALKQMLDILQQVSGRPNFGWC